MSAVKLTRAEFDELEALCEFNDTTRRASPLMRHHWHESGYRTLSRKGLVKWGPPPPGFSITFAGVTITEAGRNALAQGQDNG